MSSEHEKKVKDNQKKISEFQSQDTQNKKGLRKGTIFAKGKERVHKPILTSFVFPLTEHDEKVKQVQNQIQALRGKIDQEKKGECHDM